jgi:hypothetical protein
MLACAFARSYEPTLSSPALPSVTPSGVMPALPRISVDPFERHGISWGHLKFYPAFNYDLTYTDNATRVDKARTEDFLQEYTPAVDLRFSPQELMSFTFAYEFGWHDYLKDAAKDYLSHKSMTEGSVKNIFVEGLTLSFGNAYYQSGNTNALENLLVSFTRYQTNSAYTKAEYHFNRFTIGGKYTYGIVDYFARINRDSDYQSHTAELAGAYSFIPTRLNLIGSYQFSRAVRTVPGEDFDTHTLLVGAQGMYRKLTFSAGFGYTVAQFVEREERDEGPAFNARLVYTPHSRITASLEASRRFAAAVQTGVTTETDLKASLSLQLMRRGKLTLDYTRNDSQRSNDVSQLSFAYSGVFEYKLTRFATATAGFTHDERKVDGATGDFTINEGRVGFKLAW